MNARDMTRIAAMGRAAADEIDARGPEALDLAGKGEPVSVLRGTSYDRSRGVRRDETGELIPNDPTGETVMAMMSPRAERTKLIAAFDAFALAAMRLRDAIVTITKTAGAEAKATDKLTDALAAEDGPRDDQCHSCYRNFGYFEPVARQGPEGRIKYRQHCAWCWSFNATYGRLPPLSLLRLRHQGTPRISTAQVDRALVDEAKGKRRQS